MFSYAASAIIITATHYKALTLSLIIITIMIMVLKET